MKEVLTADSLYAQILMLRQSMTSLLLVVEGEDDYDILRHHRSEQLSVIPGIGGRPKVLRAAEKVEQDSLGGVRFLVDTDLDAVLAEDVEYPSLVFTSESHDVVMDLVILGSKHIDRMITAFVRKVERKKEVVIPAHEVRTKAMLLASKIAILRLVNEQHQLGLRLRNFPFGELKSVDPAMDEVINLAILRSKSEVPLEEILSLVSSPAWSDVSSEAVVGDHDFFAALTRVLRSYDVSVDRDVLVNSFMSSISCEPITMASWFTDLEGWASENGMRAFSCQLVA